MCLIIVSDDDDSLRFSGSGSEKWKLVDEASTRKGEEVVGTVGCPEGCKEEETGDVVKAVSLFFLSWNLAARALSRWIFRSDFCLGFGCRSLALALALEWSSFGFPKNAENWMKA